MKRIATIVLFSALAFLAAVSCRKSSEQEIEWRTELQAVKSKLVFMPGGGTETLEVNLSNVSVTSDKVTVQGTAPGSGNYSLAEIMPYDNLTEMKSFPNKQTLSWTSMSRPTSPGSTSPSTRRIPSSM